MKKILRNNKGSISALVVISVLLYSIVLTTAYMKASGKRRIQIQSQILAKEAYEKQLNHLNEIKDEINDKTWIKIGDSVNYTYDVASSYLLSSTYSGYDSNQTIEQDTTLTWKVLNVDKEKDVIDIISEKPTSNTVYFKGVLGYNNGPYLMNEICKAQYSNKTLGVEARNVNLLDMEKHLTPTGITNRNAYKEMHTKYGTTKSFIEVGGFYPRLYANQKGAGINTSEVSQPDILKGNDPYEESNAIATTEPTTDSTLYTEDFTVTQTYYGISINDTNYGAVYSVLANSTQFWVAARCVRADSNLAYFCLRVAGTGNSNQEVVGSDGVQSSADCTLRPVVSLPFNLITGEKDVNGAWNLSK